jgi:hypothetical protein
MRSNWSIFLLCLFSPAKSCLPFWSTDLIPSPLKHHTASCWKCSLSSSSSSQHMLQGKLCRNSYSWFEIEGRIIYFWKNSIERKDWVTMQQSFKTHINFSKTFLFTGNQSFAEPMKGCLRGRGVCLESCAFVGTC